MKALGCLLYVLSFAVGATAAEPPAIPPTPSAVLDLIYARPFTLEQGYEYDWSRDRPIVKSGTLVVLKVDPGFVYPRNAAEPVLYAGDQTVQRLNQGYESGHVIGIVPGNIDLAQVPIWFGEPKLPESVDAEAIRSERSLVEATNIQPFSATKVERVADSPLEFSDLHALLRNYAADLILQYSPEEKHLAETWRLPIAGATTVPR